MNIYSSGARLKTKGFTLIELLVVIAIIGLLSAVILAPVQSSRRKARDAQRVATLNSIRTALLFYFDDTGNYPVTTLGVDTGWRSQCPGWGSLANNAVVPGLVPNYLPRLPVDPLNQTTASNGYCYIYRSTGYQYKMLLYSIQESPAPEGFIDPVRPWSAGDRSWMVCDGTTACTGW